MDIVPDLPKSSPKETGKWMKYREDGSWVAAVLPVSIYCLDVETVCLNQYLALASAFDMVNQTWWAWLTTEGEDELLPFPKGCICVAHRSAFENSFTTNGYDLETSIEWLCTHTMANLLLHPTDVNLFRAVQYSCGLYNGWAPFMKGGADPSLAGLYLHFTRKVMDKSDVDIFIKGDRNDFREDLDRYFQYNFNDVRSTVLIFWRMWEDYMKYNPIFVTGLLVRSNPLFTLSKGFKASIQSLEDTYQERMRIVAEQVQNIQQNHFSLGDQGWDGLDWSVNKKGKTRWLDDKLTPGKKVFASIAQLRWQNKPLKLLSVQDGQKFQKIEKKKTRNWVCCDLKSRKLKVKPHTIRWTEEIIVDKFVERWHQLEIEDGESYEMACQQMVGVYFDNPNNTGKTPKHIVSWFTKTFLIFWENDTLTSDTEGVKELVNELVSLSFWKQIRKRLLNLRVRVIRGIDMVCPLTVVCGTVTGRAIDPVWLVLAKFEKGKLGSDLLSKVEATEKHALVYADFDSCQTLIAALISDSYAHWVEMGTGLGKVLSSDFSIAALTGNKKDETTLPYVLAKKAGVSYAHGKNCLYAMLFFVGLSKMTAMTGSVEVATSIDNTFRGKRKPYSQQYDGTGMAHNYYQSVQLLADGYAIKNGEWIPQKDNQMFSSFLGRSLPQTLRLGIREKHAQLTACNAQIQSVDQDMLNYAACWIDEEASLRGIKTRYCSTAHDAIVFQTLLSCAPELAEIYQRVHKDLMGDFLDNLGLDHDTFPDVCWNYSSVDILKNWSTNKDFVQDWEEEGTDEEEILTENTLSQD